MSEQKKNQPKLKQVSCVLDKDAKKIVEIYAILEKHKRHEDRENTNRMMTYIFEKFMDRYENDMEGLRDVIARTIHTEDSENLTKKEVNSVIQSNKSSFPLMLSDDFQERFRGFYVSLTKFIGFKITKQHLYNIMLLDYIQQHKLRYMQEIVDALMAEKFKADKKTELELSELVSQVNTIFKDT